MESEVILNVPVPSKNQSFPYFKFPSIVGTFNIDGDRRVYDGRKGLKRFDPVKWKGPRPHGDRDLDLNHGIDKAIRKGEKEFKEGLSKLLEWISHQDSVKDFVNTDFVCFRGYFTKIMCTPYENKEPWEISAVKFKGTIYLQLEITDYQRIQRETQTERQKIMSSWGYKFEQYLTEKEPFGPVNEKEEFCCVFRSRVGEYSFLYGAEMDAVSDLDSKNPSDFYEFKTSRQIDTSIQHFNFEKFKLLKWWCQSFLVGISTIVCGFRDDDGFVHTIQNFKVRDIPRRRMESRGKWEPNVCMNFLVEVLQIIKSKVNIENVLFRISSHPPGTTILIRQTGEPISHILPDWYIKSFTQ